MIKKRKLVVGFGADGRQVFLLNPESRMQINNIAANAKAASRWPNLLTSSDAIQVTEFAIWYSVNYGLRILGPLLGLEI